MKKKNKPAPPTAKTKEVRQIEETLLRDITARLKDVDYSGGKWASIEISDVVIPKLDEYRRSRTNQSVRRKGPQKNDLFDEIKKSIRRYPQMTADERYRYLENDGVIEQDNDPEFYRYWNATGKSDRRAIKSGFKHKVTRAKKELSQNPG